MERFVEVTKHVRLWVDVTGRHDASPLLLIMGANASGLAWPDDLVQQLARHHRVVRYDHRDTGRSTWAFDDAPYAITDLAEDAIAVLDDLGIERAHVVGMSMGGTLVQLLLLDHPSRLLSATVFATSALAAGHTADGLGQDPALPDPDPRLLALWESMAEPRTRDAELDWRVEHWRLLNGDVAEFDVDEFRRLEERLIDHAGRHDNPAAHARADQIGLDRGTELRGVTVPTLVIDAPEDPIHPPPHAAHLAQSIGNSQMTTVPGMGHALSRPVRGPLVDAILAHTTTIDSQP
jgi:pimeloyl-ACP methyl ester carboxylesterase